MRLRLGCPMFAGTGRLPNVVIEKFPYSNSVSSCIEYRSDYTVASLLLVSEACSAAEELQHKCLLSKRISMCLTTVITGRSAAVTQVTLCYDLMHIHALACKFKVRWHHALYRWCLPTCFRAKRPLTTLHLKQLRSRVQALENTCALLNACSQGRVASLSSGEPPAATKTIPLL